MHCISQSSPLQFVGTNVLKRDDETFKPDSKLSLEPNFGCGTAGVAQGFPMCLHSSTSFTDVYMCNSRCQMLCMNAQVHEMLFFFDGGLQLAPPTAALAVASALTSVSTRIPMWSKCPSCESDSFFTLWWGQTHSLDCRPQLSPLF